MKRRSLISLMWIVLLSVSLPVFAYDFTVDGLYYNILPDKDSTTVEVTYKYELMYDIENPYANDATGDIVIPETVTYNDKTYTVTAISHGAFCHCEEVTSIVFPGTITSIGGDAFYNTGWLNSQPDGLVYVNKVLYGYKGAMPANTSIEVREGTTMISSKAFREHKNLTSITIPNSITAIEPYTFSNCSGLKSISIPHSVTVIKYTAFWGCKGLTSLVIPGSVEVIEHNAFMYCSGLTSVVIENGVTEIGNSAFNSCTSLSEISIPHSVTNIEEYALSNTAWMNNQPNGPVYINNMLCQYNGKETSDISVEIKEGTVFIAGKAFASCAGLIEVAIPQSVTRIGRSAFTENHKLQLIYCRAQQPPIMLQNQIFSARILPEATLYVPVGSKPLYESATYWQDFAHIIELDFSGIDEVADSKIAVNAHDGAIVVTGVDSPVSIEVYTTGGQLVYQGADTTISVEPGIYLVKVGDKVVKVVV